MGVGVKVLMGIGHVFKIRVLYGSSRCPDISKSGKLFYFGTHSMLAMCEEETTNVCRRDADAMPFADKDTVRSTESLADWDLCRSSVGNYLRLTVGSFSSALARSVMALGARSHPVLLYTVLFLTLWARPPWKLKMRLISLQTYTNYSACEEMRVLRDVFHFPVV